MKTLKYYLALLLSVTCLLVPVGCLLFAVNHKSKPVYIICLVIAGISLMFNKVLTNLRVKYRQDVEYDEYGLSKTKGKYEYLSKAERDQIDLQKTADMERIVDSTALKKMTKEGSVNPETDMEKLIGLEPVKQKMKEMVARMQFEKDRNKGKKKKDITNSMSGRHMVFYGSPGTGKTTVARILTGFLYENGYIKKNKCVEVDGNFLKAGEYTATKTELVIRQAFDGVLFIDEAYALMESGDGSGEQAIATLIKQMEDNRDRFILIIAGYTNEMKKLLNANPGFESRIKEYLDFPDYNEIEMRQIFQVMANEQDFVIDAEAMSAFDERILKERKLRSFGNGRTVRNILDESIDRHALNYAEGRITEKNKFRIMEIDISRQLKRNNYSDDVI